MSTPLPTLNVVIPCYNEEDELRGCLDLLLAQSEHIAQIIVVDNNSTDLSAEILTEYTKKSSKVIMLHEAHQGVEFARNTGFAYASADIIARIDVDTRVSAGWAKAILEFYATHPEVSAGTGATEYYDLPARKFTNAMTWFFMTMSNEKVAGSVNMYGANMSIRRKVWPRVMKILPNKDARVMEDLAISLALEQLGQTIAYLPEAKADVSGRRMRTDPRKFARYNAQWPNTYRVMGYPRRARLIKAVSYFGNFLQALLAVVLRFHDPETGKFSIAQFASSYETRELP